MSREAVKAMARDSETLEPTSEQLYDYEKFCADFGNRQIGKQKGF